MFFHCFVPNKRNYVTILVIFLIGLVCLANIGLEVDTSYLTKSYSKENNLQEVDQFYLKRNNWTTSNLGSILYKNVDPDVFINTTRSQKTFVVLIWNYWNVLKARHVFNYGSNKLPHSILEDCSVKNCQFSKDSKGLEMADAVVVHMQRCKIPLNGKRRNKKQRWIFLSDESPLNTCFFSKTPVQISDLVNVFNWTMTYRSDSDVPVPYGRTIPLKFPVIVNTDNELAALSQLVPNWKDKQFEVLAMILISNCSVKERMTFLASLRGFIEVDVFGACADDKKKKKVCPGHFRKDCKIENNYLFYLVLENSACKQYLTEKAFYNAYSKGAIPVIMGTPLSDCKDLLPPNSFLHVDNYNTTKDLAFHMIEIANDYKNILTYHAWREKFKVVNEHGYFGTKSYHYCRICEALNYNDEAEKIYDLNKLKTFLDVDTVCNKSIKSKKKKNYL